MSTRSEVETTAMKLPFPSPMRIDACVDLAEILRKRKREEKFPSPMRIDACVDGGIYATGAFGTLSFHPR